MSARITAAEATTILRDLARGREDGNGGDVWPLYERAEDAMAAVVALDDELATAQSHATHALDDAATQRTRADAAEAECARLRAELAASIERGKARWGVAAELADVAAERDALAADNARLRAIVEGRTVAPTIREARAHCHGSPGSRGAFVATRLDWGAHGGARVATGLQPLPGAPHRWIALDASGRPCAWPTVALDAAGEGR